MLSKFKSKLPETANVSRCGRMEFFMKKRVFLIVLDSFGVGYAPDAADFGDVGANKNFDSEVTAKNALLNSAWHYRFFQFRHNGRVNIAYADGHVSSLTMAEAQAQTRNGNGGSDNTIKTNIKRFWHDVRN